MFGRMLRARQFRGHPTMCGRSQPDRAPQATPARGHCPDHVTGGGADRHPGGEPLCPRLVATRQQPVLSGQPGLAPGQTTEYGIRGGMSRHERFQLLGLRAAHSGVASGDHGGLLEGETATIADAALNGQRGASAHALGMPAWTVE